MTQVNIDVLCSSDQEKAEELLRQIFSEEYEGDNDEDEDDEDSASGNAPTGGKSERSELELCQWQCSPNGVFRPAATTIPQLPAGAYIAGMDDFGLFLKSQQLLTDEIIDLPDSTNQLVLKSIQKFWTAKPKYLQHGLLFKRGILLWGPPGSGKTITISLLSRDLIEKGGIVLFCEVPKLVVRLLPIIRRIESERPLIVVMEDIDELIHEHGEHNILSMLDGENQVSNVVHVATTNYIERLGPRIVNRPSRFDERIFVGMPEPAARLAYLSAVSSHTGTPLDAATLDKWVKDTDEFSIAHLRELVAAVMCLDQDYEMVLRRLMNMRIQPKDVEGYAKKKLGLA
jgi:hypothetical protein